LFSRLKEECLTPEVVEQKEGKITIKISCLGKDDAYITINLQGWTFLPEEITKNKLSIDEFDGNLSKEKISVVDDKNRRPKIVRFKD
ncbi:MAG: hypothetical protein OEY49_11735, partial [Candidatus Heimdallarchaeota archaeon]|nr:hypothetical protein [Candidatus Heimdallarchaeota archaeon]